MNRIWVKGSAASNDANVFLKKQASFESRSSAPATILRGSQYEQENHRTYGSTFHILQFPGQLMMLPHNIQKKIES